MVARAIRMSFSRGLALVVIWDIKAMEIHCHTILVAKRLVQRMEIKVHKQTIPAQICPRFKAHFCIQNSIF